MLYKTQRPHYKRPHYRGTCYKSPQHFFGLPKTLKSQFTLWLIIAFCGGCQNGESGKQAFEPSPESVGMSSIKLAYIDSLVNTYHAENKFPGGVFIIARRGKVVYYKNLGYKSPVSRQPYQKDDIFRIASMTKAVTTVAVMQLYERGKLGIDDPVSRYIPAFGQPEVLDSFNPSDSTYTSVPAKKNISIRHLLTHTSGLAYAKPKPGDIYAAYIKLGFGNRSGLSHPSWTTAQFVNNIAELPLAFNPGERYLYGYSMDVLGRVVEVVSGMTLSDYFEKNIFQPLGMNDTHFYLPRGKHSRLVPVYDYSGDGMIMHADSEDAKISRDYPKFENARCYFGGGGLSSTAMDYVKFLQSLLNPDGDSGILGRKTIELMTSDQFVRLNAEGKGMNNKTGVSHCLGFALTTGTGTDAKSPGSYEWGGAFSTKFFVDPQEELIFVGMSQAIPRYHQEFYGKMTSIIYGAIID